MQALTWLKGGVWQPVPVFAVFLSPEAQAFQLRMTERGFSPLDAVPSWASFDSLDAVASGMSGKLLGLAKVVRWLLDTPLSVGLVVAAIGCMWASLAASESSAVHEP
jgi:hypothetical protein